MSSPPPASGFAPSWGFKGVVPVPSLIPAVNIGLELLVADIEFGHPGGGYNRGDELQADRILTQLNAQRGKQNSMEKPIMPAEMTTFFCMGFAYIRSPKSLVDRF